MVKERERGGGRERKRKIGLKFDTARNVIFVSLDLPHIFRVNNYNDNKFVIMIIIVIMIMKYSLIIQKGV